MKVVDFSVERSRPIDLYESIAASSVSLGEGHGEVHVYCVRLGPGGSIGRHDAGFDQLFLVVEGSGWAEGGDGRHVTLASGRGAFFSKGEMHAKGSDAGLTALMVQADRLA